MPATLELKKAALICAMVFLCLYKPSLSNPIPDDLTLLTAEGVQNNPKGYYLDKDNVWHQRPSESGTTEEKRGFDPWHGKRSSWSSGSEDLEVENGGFETDSEDKRGFSPWAKRAFSPWAKRAFSPWAKKAFSPWAKKSFSPWAKKAFSPWAKKAFSPWAKKAFSPWAKKAFSPWAKKAFSPWAKRDEE